MKLILFLSIAIFLEPKLPFKISEKWLNFLDYTGPVVLTAIWAPIVLVKDNQINTDLGNPYLLAASLAIILALVTRNVLLTTLISMLFFFIIQ